MAVKIMHSLVILSIFGLAAVAGAVQHVYGFNAATFPKYHHAYLYNHPQFLAYAEARDYLILMNPSQDDPKTKCPKSVSDAGMCPPGDVTQMNSTIKQYGATGEVFMNNAVRHQQLFVAADGLLQYTAPGAAPPADSYSNLFTLGVNYAGSQQDVGFVTLLFNNTQLNGGNFYSCLPASGSKQKLNGTYAPVPGVRFKDSSCTTMSLISGTLALDKPDKCPFTQPYDPHNESCPPAAYRYT